MGMHGLTTPSFSLAKHNTGDQSNSTGINMNNRAAGKIERPHFTEPTAAPDPVTDRKVDKGRPKNSEQDKGSKLHPFRIGTGNQGRRNNGKHQLKRAEQQVWNRIRIGPDTSSDPSQTDIFQTADKPTYVWAKGKGVTIQHPDD